MRANPGAAAAALLVVLAYLLIAADTQATTRPSYPSFNGTGNNLDNPSWGVVNATFLRYPVSTVDNSSLGGDVRPSPRVISLALAGTSLQKRRSADNSTDLLTFLGQFITHDTVGRDFSNVTANIPVPTAPVEDPYFGYPGPNGSASRDPPPIAFNRSVFYIDADGHAQQLNKFTAYVDASVVYGTSKATADKLRSMSGGMLKEGNDRMLPLNQDLDTFNETLLTTTKGYGYAPLTKMRASGNPNVNQNPGVLVLGTLMMREHNRRARQYANNNTDASDEEVFQNARKWVIAEMQHIAFTEYMNNVDLPLPPYRGYNSSVNVGVDQFFGTAAYRYGHAVVTDTILRIDDDGVEIADGPLVLHDVYFRPAKVLAAGLDPILRGATAKAQALVEPRFSIAVQDHLFGLAGINGSDLISTNIQRGRDHGLPDYNTCRVQFGLAAVTSFSDITSDATVAAALSAVYNGNISNVDPYVGGIAEDHPAGSHFGPLFAASIQDQFMRMRDGDWWYYENSANGLFTDAEIAEIKRTGLREVMLANTNIKTLPENVYRMDASSPWNPMGTCALRGGGSGAVGPPGSLAPEQQGAPGQGLQLAPLGDNYHFNLVRTTRNGEPWVRIRVTANTLGWVGFGIARDATSRMVGADINIARIPPNGGPPEVHDYMADDFAVPILDTSRGGTDDVALISIAQTNGQTTAEWERPVRKMDAWDLPVPTDNVNMIFAYNPTTADLQYHGPTSRRYGTVSSLDVGGAGGVGGGVGGATFIARGGADRAAIHLRRAHGVLMSVTFILILPLGTLAARYLRSHWIGNYAVLASLFYVHMAFQLTGVALATAGFVIATNQFNVPYDAVPFSHGKLGVAVLALLYSQLLMGFLRPPGDLHGAARRCWEFGHAGLGRITLVLGTVNVFLGIYIFSTLYQPWDLGTWAGLCAAGVGAISVFQGLVDRHEKHQVDYLDTRQRRLTAHALAQLDNESDLESIKPKQFSPPPPSRPPARRPPVSQPPPPAFRQPQQPSQRQQQQRSMDQVPQREPYRGQQQQVSSPAPYGSGGYSDGRSSYDDFMQPGSGGLFQTQQSPGSPNQDYPAPDRGGRPQAGFDMDRFGQQQQPR